MAVTYGFYNSSNGDRKYNALQFSRLFEGIIRDGVFSTVGGSLMVVAESNLTVNISSGRAWFNNTWTNNDALLPLTLDPAEAILNRYDAIVLEVAPDERENRFKIVKGTPATTPIKPVMVKAGGIYQYPLAYIYVGKGVGSVSQANISNAVGTTECPFITGAMQQVTTNAIVAQWESEFDAWFSNVQSQLEGNVVTNLQNQIDSKLTTNGGDGKDVIVTFTEAATEAHIASGEKLSIMFGKILKMFKGKAPNSHASTATTYGVGTAENYGHVKVRNDLVGTETIGSTVSPAQIKGMNDKIPVATLEYITTSKVWTVPANKTMLSVVAIGGGGGGGAGAGSSGSGSGAGGGGGGGGIAELLNIKVTPGQTFNAVIGAGGNGGTTSGTNNGTAGGNGGGSSFGSILSVSGGLAGNGGVNTDSGGTGGVGGYGAVGSGFLGGSNVDVDTMGGTGGGGTRGATGAPNNGYNGTPAARTYRVDSKSYANAGGGGGGGSRDVTGSIGGTGGNGSAGGTTSGKGGGGGGANSVGGSGGSLNGGSGAIGGANTGNGGGGGGGAGGTGSGTGGVGGAGGAGGSGIIILLYW